MTPRYAGSLVPAAAATALTEHGFLSAAEGTDVHAGEGLFFR